MSYVDITKEPWPSTIEAVRELLKKEARDTRTRRWHNELRLHVGYPLFTKLTEGVSNPHGQFTGFQILGIPVLQDNRIPDNTIVLGTVGASQRVSPPIKVIEGNDPGDEHADDK